MSTHELGEWIIRAYALVMVLTLMGGAISVLVTLVRSRKQRHGQGERPPDDAPDEPADGA